MSGRGDTLHGVPRFWLVVVNEGRPQRAVEVTGDRFVIGRGESCDLVLDDPKVSREHAAVVPGRGPRYVLVDLDSANGTLVNGRLITRPIGFVSHGEKVAELWGDERLQFGDTFVVATTSDPRTVFSQQQTPPNAESHPHLGEQSPQDL
jgi:pSer/pThr/pTyr-binding forkhead associated (FHA) protein